MLEIECVWLAWEGGLRVRSQRSTATALAAVARPSLLPRDPKVLPAQEQQVARLAAVVGCV
jgi:hypothetical protein